jgi:Tfp pilus assembly pilus retraction ATPase PilT
LLFFANLHTAGTEHAVQKLDESHEMKKKDKVRQKHCWNKLVALSFVFTHEWD